MGSRVMSVLGLLRNAFVGPATLADPDDGAAARFERDYPAGLAGRLGFLERRLGVPRERILRLAGAPAGFAADPAVAREPWDALVGQQSAAHRQTLAAAERALVDYLARFGYDPDAAAAHLRDHRADELFSRAADPDRDDILLALMADGNEWAFLDLMTEFLARPAA